MISLVRSWFYTWAVGGLLLLNWTLGVRVTRCSLGKKKYKSICINELLLECIVFKSFLELQRCCLLLCFRVKFRMYLVDLLEFPQQADFHRPGVLLDVGVNFVPTLTSDCWLVYLSFIVCLLFGRDSKDSIIVEWVPSCGTFSRADFIAGNVRVHYPTTLWRRRVVACSGVKVQKIWRGLKRKFSV